MVHPDWPAFAAAILAHPDDDTVRLVAADFLEENGDPDRAAFIRIQCALAALERDGQGKSPAADELRKKERGFLGPLSVARLIWSAEACPELVRVSPPRPGGSALALPRVEGADRLTWRRGFVERVSCPAVDWLRHGAAVRARQPIREVELTHCDATPRDLWYAHLDALRGLAQLWISTPDGDDWLRRWLPGTRLWALND
jgi:uncharacterized protein (TIGR02996 family)